jgi:uncharacterized protein (TIGR03437 family)
VAFSGPFDGDDAYSFQLDIQVPAALPPGPADLVVTTKDGSSAPFPLQIRRRSPAFIYPSLKRSPSDRNPLSLINTCFVGQDTLTPGETLVAYAVGLGPAEAGVAAQIMVGGRAAEIVDAIPEPGRTGVTRITFRVPPGDGIAPIVLTIGGESSQPILMPVGNVKGWSTLGLQGSAPEALISTQSCGPNLAEVGESFRGDPKNPPFALGGVTLTVRDSAGVERRAPIVEMNCCSISYVLPAGTADGLATVIAGSARGSISGYLNVHKVWPALPLIVGAHNGNPEISGYVVYADGGSSRVESGAALLPIGLYGFQIGRPANAGDVYLVLFGTGLRNRSALANVKAVVAGVEAAIEYAGPQSEAAGLDQVNVKLPRSLLGSGLAILQIVVDGIPATYLYLEFK